MQKHAFKQITKAVKNSGLPDVKDVSFLGEGAWHVAYLVTDITGEKLVIRFPKEESIYESKVEYDESRFHADYAGTKKYYELANKVKKGVCPKFFTYHVEEGNTYTIETYMGNTINLASLTEKEAFEIGFQVGELFRLMHEIDHGLKGFGYLSWNGKEVVGSFQTDVTQSMEEENAELLSDYEELCEWDPRFEEVGLKDKLSTCLSGRTIKPESVVFTNQDCSPENLLINEETLAAIDPFPILYDGNSMAGNFMNCYEAIFPTYHNTKRYEKHKFNHYINELKQIAKGYLVGYSGGNKEIELAVRKEQFIKLADLCFNHYKLISGDLSKSAEIGVGTKEAMKERLHIFLQMLKDIKIK